MRLSGFATGMDVNQMVQDLMRAERMPMDRMRQEQQHIEWKMEQYREINLKLDQFRNNIFDTVYRRANMLANKATSSNEQLVTAAASSSAGNASVRISSVDSLASAATNASAGEISGDEKINVNGALSGQSLSDNSFWQSGIVNREVITVDQRHTTINLNQELGNTDTVVVSVNGVSYTVVQEFGEGDIRATQVMIDEDEGALIFGEELAAGATVDATILTPDEDGPDLYTVSELTTFNAQGEAVTETFVFTGDQSLNEIMNQMNESNSGISVFYDEYADRLSVSRTDTGRFRPDGEEREMIFSGDFFTEALQLGVAEERGGTNAEFTVNGLTTYRHSNTFIMNDLAITLEGTFTEDDPAVTVSSSTDTDRILETITEFVEEYNELVEWANEKLGERFYRDYPALTDDQKADMTDREIEQWEERAMSGVLRNDSLIRGGFNTFRMDVYTPVNLGPDAAFNQVAQIGITTTNDYLKGGLLEIDEDKLRAAIETDAEAVFQLIGGDGSEYGDKGIARRIRESADGLIEQISQRAGGMRGRNINHQFTLGRELNTLDDRLSNFERRMQQVEQRYWSQFNAMERAVAQANAQAESLFAQLYGGM